jgi:DNA-binding Lrp family transcriptional regulator
MPSAVKQDGGVAMVTALVMLNVSRDRINAVASELAGMDGITEVYSVAGEFDLVATIRVKENEQLAEMVTDHLLKVEGITRSQTLIAFRVHSKHDLERMFSLGMEA